VAAGAQADHVDSATDVYAELFAEAERAAEREREQPALFDAQPTAADVAAAQPLHVDDATTNSASPTSAGRSGPTAEALSTDGRSSTDDEAGAENGSSTEEESSTRDSELTVSQATRQAEIIAELRAELDAHVAAAQTPAPRRGADSGDEDSYVRASRDDDVDSRTDVASGQGLST
jgi:hypothetical protein